MMKIIGKFSGESIFLSFLFLIYMYARFGIYWGLNEIFAGCLICLVGFSFIYFSQISKIQKGLQFVLVVVALITAIFMCSLFSIFSLGARVKASFYYSALMFSNFFLAYILTKKTICYEIASLYLVSIFLWVLYLIFHHANPNDVFPHYSRNSFSILFLEAAALLYIIIIQERNFKKNCFGKYPLWPAVVAFLCSVWAVGRSGILSTGFLLLGVVFANFLTSEKKFKYLITSFVLIAFVLCVFLNWQKETFGLVTKRFTVEGLTERSRIEIAIHYFKKIKESPARLFFGYDVHFDSYLATGWKSNLHNSLLRLHSVLGIVGVILLFFVIKGIFNKGRSTPLLWFVGGALLLRSLTDTAFLPGPTDFLFFYFLFSQK